MTGAADRIRAFHLREQQTNYFAGDLALWRLSLPSVAPPLELPGAQLVEWGGSLRWRRSGADATPALSCPAGP